MSNFVRGCLVNLEGGVGKFREVSKPSLTWIGWFFIFPLWFARPVWYNPQCMTDWSITLPHLYIFYYHSAGISTDIFQTGCYHAVITWRFVLLFIPLKQSQEGKTHKLILPKNVCLTISLKAPHRPLDLLLKHHWLNYHISLSIEVNWILVPSGHCLS